MRPRTWPPSCQKCWSAGQTQNAMKMIKFSEYTDMSMTIIMHKVCLAKLNTKLERSMHGGKICLPSFACKHVCAAYTRTWLGCHAISRGMAFASHLAWLSPVATSLWTVQYVCVFACFFFWLLIWHDCPPSRMLRQLQVCMSERIYDVHLQLCSHFLACNRLDVITSFFLLTVIVGVNT
jgi:hypothetical protein